MLSPFRGSFSRKRWAERCEGVCLVCPVFGSTKLPGNLLCTWRPGLITIARMNKPTPEQIAGEEPSDRIVIYWEREYSTAIAPERLKLDFMPHRPLLSGMSLDEQRAVAVEG